MGSFIWSYFLVVFVECAVTSGLFLKPNASTEAVLIDLQQTQREDRSCFVKFDRILAKLWGETLNGTDISDLGTIPKSHSFQEPKKPKYNTRTEEWLMEDSNPDKRLQECSAGLYKSVVNKLDNETRVCVDELLKNLLKKEAIYASITEKVVNDEKNLPFRQFLSFNDIEFVVFQNRSMENFTEHEKNTYGHMKSYVPEVDDKRERTWILRQECNWEDLRDIEEAKDEQIPDLFRKQVVQAVDRELGNQLVRHFDLTANISHDSYSDWLKARENMMTEVETVVGKLNTVKNDSQWICEYASEIGTRFAVEQARILLPQSDYYLSLKAEDIAIKARDVKEYLETLKDNRTNYFKELADGFDADIHCLGSVRTMMLDHQRYDIAANFISEDLSYPEIFCREMNLNLGLLAPEYCKCVGSFCVSHGIAALFAERLEMKKNQTTGAYVVGTTNINEPTKKVVSWPGVKEI